jgi:hypothetical protein
LQKSTKIVFRTFTTGICGSNLHIHWKLIRHLKIKINFNQNKNDKNWIVLLFGRVVTYKY